MKYFLFATLTLFFLVINTNFAISIRNSKHNLSSGGKLGNLKSDDTSMICIFCHTSHIGHSSVPMWNRKESKVIYSIYESSTLYSSPDQPDGASKLCLSCHDGTIALGNLLNQKNSGTSFNSIMGKISPFKSTYLGLDLSDDHPISFDPGPAVNISPHLTHPTPFDQIKYDAAGKIQCTTCHNPHDNIYKKFLVKSDRNGAICKSCHNFSNYNGISTHDISNVSWNGKDVNPWPHTQMRTVRENSCMNCHRSHNAIGKERLLVKPEENVCLSCHNGNLGKNIKNTLLKTSGHRVNYYQGIHDPTENLLMKGVHVECVDCHNPHQINSIKANAPHINGKLAGVSGMSVNGVMKSTAQWEYEVCLKCHGQDKYQFGSSIQRLTNTANINIAINPINASYHAIAAQGKNHWVPSLKPPYTTSSRLYCTDCHNNSAYSENRTTESKGPHGSNYEYILEKQYVTSDYTPWSEANYALCYKCHNPFIIFDQQLSGFEHHQVHVRVNSTPCYICHDPHGSPNNIGLINFDAHAVLPNSEGILKFEVIGNKGYCFLQCHSRDHNPKFYRRK